MGQQGISAFSCKIAKKKDCPIFEPACGLILLSDKEYAGPRPANTVPFLSHARSCRAGPKEGP
jgi:hypothetical protein